MSGPTHRQFSIFFVYIAAILLNIYQVIDINFYLQVVIMLAMGRTGALFPDIDHAWDNVAEKTIPNWIINKFIHLTGGKHRSRHTHSWDICLVSFIVALVLVNLLQINGVINNLDSCVAFLILCGFYSGWISHLFSDMLSSSGVYITCLSGIKIRFVPKQIFGFKFSTNSPWEKWCCKFIRIVNAITGFVVILYPLIINGSLRNLLLRLINIFN